MTVGVFCGGISAAYPRTSSSISHIFTQISNLFQIHLHGHDFLLLASGIGTYNDSVLASANLINPVRRDVVTLPSPGFGAATGGFIVIAFPLDNPGIWVWFIWY